MRCCIVVLYTVEQGDVGEEKGGLFMLSHETCAISERSIFIWYVGKSVRIYHNVS